MRKSKKGNASVASAPTPEAQQMAQEAIAQTTTDGTKTPEQVAAAKRDRRPPIRRATHPALKPDAAGNATVKLTEWPADHSSIYHKALDSDDFTDEVTYYRAKATWHEREMTRLRTLADETAKLGTGEQRAAAKKLLALQAQITALTEQLSADNVDVEALRRAMNAKFAKPSGAGKETSS
jgi:hypothetical protein